MKERAGRLPLHLARIGTLCALLALGMLYPYLPGEYDRLAQGISTTAQAVGALGLLLVPPGALWLGYEVRQQARRRRGLPAGGRRRAFALLSLVAALPAAAGSTLAAVAGAGPAFGLLVLALWVWIFYRAIAGVRGGPEAGFYPAPLYLVLLPAAALVLQVALSSPAASFSRGRAIANSAALIRDIEAYHAAHGRYPEALQGVWKDYSPGVTGIEKYHYARDGQAYNLFFEQPRFLFGPIGVREFVVYHPQDKQVMVSHTAWILTLPPEQLESAQGWYAVQEAPEPHWKVFWFD